MYGFSVKGDRYAPGLRGADAGQAVCFVIGAMAAGHVDADDFEAMVRLRQAVRIPLSGATAINRALGAIEAHRGISQTQMLNDPLRAWRRRRHFLHKTRRAAPAASSASAPSRAGPARSGPSGQFRHSANSRTAPVSSVQIGERRATCGMEAAPEVAGGPRVERGPASPRSRTDTLSSASPRGAVVRRPGSSRSVLVAASRARRRGSSPSPVAPRRLADVQRTPSPHWSRTSRNKCSNASKPCLEVGIPAKVDADNNAVDGRVRPPRLGHLRERLRGRFRAATGPHSLVI